jgi:hypothetical protein
VRAALHRDRAAWAAGRDRAGAVADARGTRARLPDAARLKREAARIDEWLARASRTK